MAETESQEMVAVINSNEDIVEAIRLMLDDAGIASVGAHVVDFKKGRKDLIAFYQEYNPRVIVYDIAPPYEENWKFFQLVKAAQQAQGRHFLLTTTNKAVLDTLVGQTEAIEVIGKPFDLDEIVAAVKKKLNE